MILIIYVYIIYRMDFIKIYLFFKEFQYQEPGSRPKACFPGTVMQFLPALHNIAVQIPVLEQNRDLS